MFESFRGHHTCNYSVDKHKQHSYTADMHTIPSSRGFTVLHVLLAIIVIALLCFAGWRVWQAQTTDNATPNSTPQTREAVSGKEATTTYTPDFGNFTITYPTSW